MHVVLSRACRGKSGQFLAAITLTERKQHGLFFYLVRRLDRHRVRRNHRNGRDHDPAERGEVGDQEARQLLRLIERGQHGLFCNLRCCRYLHRLGGHHRNGRDHDSSECGEVGDQEACQLLRLIGKQHMSGGAMTGSRFFIYVRESVMIWNVFLYVSGVVCAIAVIAGFRNA
jgi:hypothetical protein